MSRSRDIVRDLTPQLYRVYRGAVGSHVWFGQSGSYMYQEKLVVAVRDVVRAVVAECAPHEVPLVEGLREFDDARVVAILARRGGAENRWALASQR